MNLQLLQVKKKNPKNKIKQNALIGGWSYWRRREDRAHSDTLSQSFTGTYQLSEKKTVFLLYGTAPLINFLMLYGVLDRDQMSHSQIL